MKDFRPHHFIVMVGFPSGDFIAVSKYYESFSDEFYDESAKETAVYPPWRITITETLPGNGNRPLRRADRR